MRGQEMSIEKLKEEIKELKTKIEKKKVAKNIMLDEKVPVKKIKVKKPIRRDMELKHITELKHETEPILKELKEKEVEEDGNNRG
jgi:hypothetical protein